MWKSLEPCATVPAAHRSTVNQACGSAERPHLLVTCSDDRTLRTWDLSRFPAKGADSTAPTPTREYVGHTSFVNACDVDQTGRFLASVSFDRTLRLWHEDAREAVFQLRMGAAGATAVQFHPEDVRYVFVGAPGGVQLWDLRQHRSYLALLQPAAPVGDDSLWRSARLPQSDHGHATCATPTPAVLWPAGAACSSTDPWAPLVPEAPDRPVVTYTEAGPRAMKRVFEPFSKRWVLPFRGHTPDATVYSALVTRDGQHLISSATDGTHKLWSVTSGRGLATMDGHSPAHSTRPCLSRDDRWLVGGTREGDLLVWRTFGPNEPSIDDGLGGDDGGTVSHDARRACVRMRGGNWERRAEGRHSYPITAVALPDDDTVVATADESGTIKLTSAYR